MVDEIKSIRDTFFKVLAAGISGQTEEETRRRGLLDVNLKGAKDLIGSLAGWAGKGKDEIVQLVCREIGNAMAGVLTEPIAQVLEGRKLQLTIELVPSEGSGKSGKKGKSPHSAATSETQHTRDAHGRSKTHSSNKQPRKRKASVPG